MVNNVPIAGNRFYCGLGGFAGYDFLHTEELMKPVQNDASESANIISIETLKRANAPEKPVSSIAADIFNGLESISKNPVIAPLFTAGANALQAYAMQIL